MTKKAMAKGTKDSKRDWGKGFACTGRNKVRAVWKVAT